MSVYTTTIKNYIESFTDYKDINAKLYDKIATGIPHLFDFDFPWYCDDIGTLEAFKKAFVVHFYGEEIGYETIELFKLNLNDVLTRNMPRYADLYYSQKIIGNLLENTNMTFDDTSTNDVTSTNKTTDDYSGDGQSIHSDNPQVNFSGVDYASMMDRSQSKSKNVSDGKNVTEGVDTRHNTTKGWSGSKMDEIIKYRNHIVNLNNIIIGDCEPLFMGIFEDFAEHGNDFNFVGYGNYGNIGHSIDWMR